MNPLLCTINVLINHLKMRANFKITSFLVFGVYLKITEADKYVPKLYHPFS